MGHKWDARAAEWPIFTLTTGNKTKTKFGLNELRLKKLSHNPVAFEQVCPSASF